MLDPGLRQVSFSSLICAWINYEAVSFSSVSSQKLHQGALICYTDKSEGIKHVCVSHTKPQQSGRARENKLHSLFYGEAFVILDWRGDNSSTKTAQSQLCEMFWRKPSNGFWLENSGIRILILIMWSYITHSQVCKNGNLSFNNNNISCCGLQTEIHIDLQ